MKSVNDSPLLEVGLAASFQLQRHMSLAPAIPSLAIFPMDILPSVQNDTCTSSVLAKVWRYLKYPSIGDGLNQLRDKNALAY